jgi:hypothetical protein
MLRTAEILGIDKNEETNRLRSVRTLILQHTRQNEDGTTVSEIAAATGLPRHRIRSILTELEQEREIYSRRIIGSNAILYYPNGKLVHKYLQRSKEFGPQIFKVSFHEGRGGPKMQIQERSFSLLEGEKIEGSIFVDNDSIDGLLMFIGKLKEDFTNFER